MKRLMVTLLTMVLLLTGCGSANGNSKDSSQDPLAVAAEEGVFHYGDTRETVEKVLGTESEPAMNKMPYYRDYPDGTSVVYRDIDGEELAVLIFMDNPKYTTYQGICVGDSWDEVKGRLGEIAEVGASASILFEGSERIDPWTVLEDRTDACISVNYWMAEDGTVEKIAISDKTASTTFR